MHHPNGEGLTAQKLIDAEQKGSRRSDRLPPCFYKRGATVPSAEKKLAKSLPSALKTGGPLESRSVMQASRVGRSSSSCYSLASGLGCHLLRNVPLIFGRLPDGRDRRELMALRIDQVPYLPPNQVRH